MEVEKQDRIKSVAVLIGFEVLATFIGLIFRDFNFPEANIVVMYILAVFLIARFSMGYIYGILGTILSTTAYNLFFTKPYYELSVYNPTYIITFIIMSITAIITSTLMWENKLMMVLAKENAKVAKVLYNLTNSLSMADNYEQVGEISLNLIKKYFKVEPGFLLINGLGQPEDSFCQIKGNGEFIRCSTGKLDFLPNLQEQHGYIGKEFYECPIFSGGKLLGLIRLPLEVEKSFSQNQWQLLFSMLENIGLVMDRIYIRQEHDLVKEEAMKEHYRGNLLRSISHDIRTPLTVIIGNSEILLDKIKEPEYGQLLGNINGNAKELHALVENILSLTRIEYGNLVLKKEPEVLEEVVGSAVLEISKNYKDVDIDIKLPEEIVVVPMEARLIRQVIINLLDNAIKHGGSKKGIKIEIALDATGEWALCKIMDEGKGIKKECLQHLFEMFYTEDQEGGKRGIGLGLAICDSIIKAHQGTIKAENRQDTRGAVFTISLPLAKEEEHGE